jgi:hypothetical protein
MKGWHARRDQGASPEGSALSRRTLTKGAVWTTPLLVTAVAAPAYAASGPCVGGQAPLTSGTRPVNLQFLPSTVTATIGWSSTGAAGNDQTPGETGLVRTTQFNNSSNNWNYLKQHLPDGMTQGDTVTLTLTFNQPVSKLSLTITDIDKDTSSWIDEVVVTPVGFTSVKATNVIGTGTALDPFKSKVEGGIDSTLGDVTLTWAGPVTQVQVIYRAADVQNQSGIGQHIGVGKIGFTC